MYKNKERKLIVLFAVLLLLLVAILVIITIEKQQQQLTYVTPVQEEKELTSQSPLPIQPTDTTLTTEPSTQWAQVPEVTSQPMPEEVRIEVNKNMRIQAIQHTGSLSALTGEVKLSQFNKDLIAETLFLDKQSTRDVEKLKVSVGERYDVTNAAGEYLLVQDGRVEYAYRKDLAIQYRELTQYLTYTDDRERWLYQDRKALEQDLDYMRREEAAQYAEESIQSLLGGDSPFSVKAEKIYACTFAELKTFDKKIRADSSWRYDYDHRPGMEDGGNKGDGVYFIQLRFYMQNIPFYSEAFEYEESVDANSSIGRLSDMSASMILTAQGILYCRMAYTHGPKHTLQSVDVITFDEAVNRFVQVYRDVISTKNVTINEIRLKYVVMRKGEGKSARYFLQPVWCFAAENQSGKPEDRNFYYIDAITGEELSKS